MKPSSSPTRLLVIAAGLAVVGATTAWLAWARDDDGPEPVTTTAYESPPTFPVERAATGAEGAAPDAGAEAIRSRDGNLHVASNPHTATRRLVVEDADGPHRVYDLEVPVIPEAFATDSRSLFVLAYPAPQDTSTYALRELDLATGSLGEVLGPDKLPLAEEMKGTSRRQVWAPDGRRLYTLYTRQGSADPPDDDAHHGALASTDGGHDHQGFVHVLDLSDRWAFCLDLPAAFGHGPLGSAALAVSRSGDRLAVVDAPARQVALLDPVGLVVDRVLALPDDVAPDPSATVHAALTPVHLLVGWGSDLARIDLASGALHGVERLGHPIAGLGLGADGRLYATGAAGEVTVVPG